MFLGIAMGTEINTTAVAKDIYNKKISKAIKSVYDADYDFDYDSCKSFLYDFDKNGQKELVLYYYKKGEYGAKRVISVYTVKNNKVKTMIKSKVLYVDIAGPNGFVGVFKKNGKRYLACQGETGETGGGTSVKRYGKFEIYKISGTRIKKKYTAKYRLNCHSGKAKVNKKGNRITINGKKKSYKKFIRWLKSFKLSKCKREKSAYWKYRYACTGYPLNSLIYVGGFS